MTSITFPWKRFWCPRNGQIKLDSNRYLADPNARWGHVYNPDVVPLDRLSGIPCLVLLGEPGSGKSRSLDEIVQQPAASAEPVHDQQVILRFDLAEFTTDQWLYQRIFENGVLQEWGHGKGNLTLIFDSFDECTLPRSALVALLAEGLGALPVDRLLLRVACRTSEWPLPLEERLRSLWGNDQIGVYELAPLRRVDVDAASATIGLDPVAFRQAVARAEAVPLALKPLTLRFLLTQFGKHLALPSTQVGLYAAGCRTLCDEWDERREGGPATSAFSVEDRLAVAARIAAVTVFARRVSLWTGKDDYNAPDQAVTVSDLADDPSSSGRLGIAAVRDTLRTGLFTSRGPAQMGWVHQTFAEYLAARFLVDHDFSLQQILSLLVHPADSKGRLMPHLHGTAAWLASMRLDVFRTLLRVEPELLLQSDVATATSHDREALVATLLDLYDAEEAIDTDRSNRQRYAKLAHPGLAEQLRPYIADRVRGPVVRRVAIDIAMACDVRVLVPLLTAVALDSTDAYAIREEAADSVAALADAAGKLALKSLAVESDAEDDPEDELKGTALAALWPDQLSTQELFSALTPPRDDLSFGAYFRFLLNLRDTLHDTLRAEDLPIALQWAQTYAALARPNQLAELVDVILRAAWAHFDVPGVVEGFARVALERIRNLDRILEESGTGHDDDKDGGEPPSIRLTDDLERDTEKRHMLVGAMIEVLAGPNSEDDPLSLLYAWPPIVTREDLFWLIDLLEAEQDGARQQILARLIARSVSEKDLDLIDAVLDASRRVPVLADQCRELFDPVLLASSEAKRARQAYQQQESRRATLQAQRQADVDNLMPRDKQVRIILDQVDAGDGSAWWRLTLALTLNEDGTPTGHQLAPDVRTLPGWQAATASDRRRMLEAATRYVLVETPEADQWLGTGSMPWKAIAGFKALLLLLREAPDDPVVTNPTIWQKWAPVVVGYPMARSVIGEDEAKDIVRAAYRVAAPEVLTAFGVLIDRACDASGRIYRTEALDICWDDHVALLLLDKARAPGLKPDCLGDLLLALLGHSDTAAREYAASLVRGNIPSPSDEQPEARLRAVAAACALLTYPDGATWRTVWPVFMEDEPFGSEVMLALHSAPYTEERLASQLTEAELADLFLWMCTQLPNTMVERERGIISMVTPEQSLTEWCRGLTAIVAQRGSPEAIAALQRIMRDSPVEAVRRRVKWELIDAERIVRLRTVPTPPSPSEIIALARNRRRRLVQNGEQLQEAILESLARLEADLQQETPAITDIWNMVHVGNTISCTPMEEEVFSDKIKRHLEADLNLQRGGIIVNREVQIRRRMGQVPGQETDLQIDAMIPGHEPESYDSITVIAEVKGSWHRELKTAMRTQLVDRYLKDSGCPYGLYIVGWFNCLQWDNGDPRRQQANRLKMTLADARALFEHQASDLSSEGILVRACVLDTALRSHT